MFEKRLKGAIDTHAALSPATKAARIPTLRYDRPTLAKSNEW
jgi:hypothetical protein